MTARFFSSSHCSLTRVQSATAVASASYSCAILLRSCSICVGPRCASGSCARLLLGAAQLHGEQRALDLERGRALQAAGQPDIGAGGNQPLGRIPLPPAHAVAVIVREDVVEVVVALTEGHQRQHRIVAGGVLLGVRARAPHVRQGVDEEREVMADDQTGDAGEQQRAPGCHRSAQPTRIGRPKLLPTASSA